MTGYTRSIQIHDAALERQHHTALQLRVFNKGLAPEAWPYR